MFWTMFVKDLTFITYINGGFDFENTAGAYKIFGSPGGTNQTLWGRVVLEAHNAGELKFRYIAEGSLGDTIPRIYIYESNEDYLDPSKYTTIYSKWIGKPAGYFDFNDKVNINKKYVILESNVFFNTPYFMNFYWLKGGLFSGHVKTPLGFPVFNAIVKSDKGDSVITDINGLYTLAPNIASTKLWAEKSINKTISNKTAKEISLLKEINVDV